MVEAKPISYCESSLEFSKRSRIYVGTGRPNTTHVSTSIYQIYLRDQPKLNFGTKFLLEGKTVTIRNFKSLFRCQKFHYSSRKVTIHQLLFIDHYSSFYYSSFFVSVWDSEKRSENLLFTWHYSFPKRNHYSCTIFISS